MNRRNLAKILESGGIDDADFEATQLISHFAKVSIADAMLCDIDEKLLSDAVNRRLGGEPLQYILGFWEFYGLPFKVSPACLIPRSDTEILCGYLIDKLPQNGRFADLCTGSGCIAIAALANRRDADGVAIELYRETVEIAKENSEKNGVCDRLEIICADATTDCLCGMYDAIVANPPYVTLDEMEGLQKEVTFEPRHALTDGGNGLSIIEKIIEHSPAHLKENGFIAIEIGYMQGTAVAEIGHRFGLSVEILKDTENRDRVAVLRK